MPEYAPSDRRATDSVLSGGVARLLARVPEGTLITEASQIAVCEVVFRQLAEAEAAREARRGDALSELKLSRRRERAERRPRAHSSMVRPIRTRDAGWHAGATSDDSSGEEGGSGSGCSEDTCTGD